MSFTTQDIWWS